MFFALIRNVTNNSTSFRLRFISGIIDRKSHDKFKPHVDDANEIVNWGLTHPYHGVIPPNVLSPTSHTLKVNPFISPKQR